MEDLREKLFEFIKTFGGSTDLRLWITLVEEEHKELIAEDFGTQNHLKELADLAYVHEGLMLVSADTALLALLPEEEGEKALETLSSAQMYAMSQHSKYPEGIFEEAVFRVHASNMSKLGEDGKPIKREDGKVLKGPNYKAPDLSDLVEKLAA